MTENKKRFVNRMLGFDQDRDEREEQLVYSNMTMIFLISYCLLLLLFFVSVCVDAFNQTLSMGSILLFILAMFDSVAVLVILRKNALDKELVYTDDEYKLKVKSVKIKCFLGAILFTLLSILLNTLYSSIMAQKFNLTYMTLVQWLIGGVIFGFGSYFLVKSKITIEKE